MLRKGGFLGCVTLLVWLLGASTAHAAFPGQNGKIAYDFATAPSDGPGIYTMNPDGSKTPFLLNTATEHWFSHSWSPDGTKMLLIRVPLPYVEPQIISTINADGTGLTPIGPGNQPEWAPDGPTDRVRRSGLRQHLRHEHRRQRRPEPDPQSPLRPRHRGGLRIEGPRVVA